MTQAGFEPKISEGERPQTYALDRAATGTGRIPSSAHLYCTSYMFRIDPIMMAVLRPKHVALM